MLLYSCGFGITMFSGVQLDVVPRVLFVLPARRVAGIPWHTAVKHVHSRTHL
jgi:hypothetical protein